MILNELILNAVKHNTSEGGGVAVRVNFDEENQTGSVSVFNRHGRLPPELDLAAGVGQGMALRLVKALLPGTGASLAITLYDIAEFRS